LSSKAIQAAESFLLARYHLYDQVYFHKTTRGLELLLTACLKRVAELSSKGRWEDLNLAENHPLVQFMLEKDPGVALYLTLDDFVVWGALELISQSKDDLAKDFADRILNRKLPKCLDVEKLFDTSIKDRIEISRRAKQFVKDKLGTTVFIDSPKLSIYGSVREDEQKLHKRLSIAFDDDVRREITRVSPAIATLESPRQMLRIYFLNEKDKEETKKFALAKN
jgi:HD superfamily phosphohydrolase